MGCYCSSLGTRRRSMSLIDNLEETMRILCWSISTIIIIGWVICRILHPGNANFPHHFFLFKYSLDLLFINIAIVVFLWPFLISKGIIGANYHDENKFGKAKIFLILYGLFFPGLILVFISSLVTKEAYIPSSMLLILYCYAYLKNGYIYLKKNRRY